MKFTVDVIDTWEMSITPVKSEFVVKQQDRYYFVDTQGRSVALPGTAGMALRIERAGTRGVPFVDAGAGVTLTDIHSRHHSPQRLLPGTPSITIAVES